MSKIPHNMNFAIGDDLREVPLDAVQMQKGLAWLENELLQERKSVSVKQAALLSQIGVYARILGDLDLAEKSFNDAIEVLEAQKRPDLILGVKLRLAIVYQFKGSYTKADNFYMNAIKVIRSSTDEKISKYLDFALQHLAKSRFEQKFYQESLNYFLEALEIRLIKGDIELIQSTEKAISKVREKMD
jgi:tetratricopeptide (TPR) repeat protein